MHNIYPTLKHLLKWKLHHSGKCSNCDLPETLKHAIFECPIAKDAINKLEKLIGKFFKTNIPPKLTYENLLLGTCSSVTNFHPNFHNKKAIDTLLILLKQKLILQRDNKVIIELNELELMITDRINLEHYGLKSFSEGSLIERRKIFEKRWNRTDIDSYDRQ